MPSRFAITLLAFAACFSTLAAEPDSEEESSPLAPLAVEPDPWLGEEEPLLSGPRLSEEAEARTLVRFEFSGNLRRLDRTPEEAALNALNLPRESRDQVDKIVRESQTALDEFVSHDPDVFVLLQRARQAGNKPEAPALVAQLAEGIDRATGTVRLRDRLAPLLPESERRDFQRMIDEYWRAVVLDEMQQAQNRNDKFTLAQARVRVTLNAAATEIRRAFERRCVPHEHVLEELIVALDPSDKQNEKVRKPIEAAASRTKSKPNARDLYELSVRVVPALDAPQKLTWLRLLLGVAPPQLETAKSAG
ncbi:MAG: hypothetical protein KF691_00475 [Phycisphaeraceae bacterium]|nr:hypothetical protein [Phycisphaeraceae bacterium]